MKPFTVCLVFSVLILQNAKSQDSLKPKSVETNHSHYKATFSLFHGQTMRANLMAIKDSSVFIYQKSSNSPDPFHKLKVNMNLSSNWDQYNYKFIESIKIDNKKIKSLTIITGAVAGLIGGVLIGKNAHSSATGFDELYAQAGGVVLGGFLGVIVGGATGLIVASSLEKKYLINGEWKNLEEMKASLKY